MRMVRRMVPVLLAAMPAAAPADARPIGFGGMITHVAELPGGGSSALSVAAPSDDRSEAREMLPAMLVGGVGIVVVLLMAVAALKPAAREPAEADGEPEPVDTGGFDRRVAQRLAELKGEAVDPEPAAATDPRAFGRKESR